MMRKFRNVIFLSVWILNSVLSTRCASSKPTPAQNAKSLSEWMCGDFKAHDQGLTINVHIRRIWPKDKERHWLYVEQDAVESGFEKLIYRKRIYEIHPHIKDTLICNIYIIKDTLASYYQNIEIFEGLSEKNLALREGCSVYFYPGFKNFKGSMRDKSCVNTLRGSEYIQSKIVVTENNMECDDSGMAYTKKGAIKRWGKKKYIFQKQTYTKIKN